MEIGLFGRVAIRRNSTVFTGFPTKKVAELLALLALNIGHAVNRKDAIALMWYGSQGPRAGNRLSATLYLLRQVLEREFGDDASELFGTGDGSLWLNKEVQTDVRSAEQWWNRFKNESDVAKKKEATEHLAKLYQGHLCGDLQNTWFEPMRSLWASRWTESLLWIAEQDTGEVDRILAELARIQPILPVTKSRVISFLEKVQREDLSESWKKAAGTNHYPQPESGRLTGIHTADIVTRPLAFELPTVTYMLVRSRNFSVVQDLAAKCGSGLVELHDGGFAITTRNPIAARIAAAELRTQDPYSSIYISTRVHNPNDQLPGQLTERYSQIQAGEVLMNPSAASLIEQHEVNVILERKVGRSEYRLI